MNVRPLLGAALAAALAATFAAPASPAQAAEPQMFSRQLSSRCLDSWGQGEHEAVTYTCNYPDAPYQMWDVKVIDEPRAHAGTVVRLKNHRAGTCLDSNGRGPAYAVVRACNTSDYQLWEVFSSGSTIRFKSWGAWTHASKHMCLAYYESGDGPSQVFTETCDADSPREYWR
jgi:hypothetical protein